MKIICFLLSTFISLAAVAQTQIKMEEINKHVGDSVKVCTKIYSRSIVRDGFALMLLGILISSANKKVISDNRVTGLFIRFAEDPKQKEDPMENLTLVRNEATRLGDYIVPIIKHPTISKKIRHHTIWILKKNQMIILLLKNSHCCRRYILIKRKE